jgi:hypothetical protein
MARHHAPKVAMVPFAHPITVFAKKVQLKEKYVFVVKLNKEKLRIPYRDVITIERKDEKVIRITYVYHGQWSVEIGKGKPTRINKYLVRYDRPDGVSVFVGERE